uniref:Uncharacterized protein n=1 Tax=Amphimedon queenslandica TaxID=400682 RepID=A0A1X7V3R0_AMPQE
MASKSCVLHIRYDHSNEEGKKVEEVRVKQDYNDSGRCDMDRRTFLEEGARAIDRNGEPFHFKSHGLLGHHIRGIFLVKVHDSQLGDQCIGIGYSLGWRNSEYTIALGFYDQDAILNSDDVDSLFESASREAMGTVREGRDITISNSDYTVIATLDYHANGHSNVATVVIKRT